jgi:hypothetical protein
MMDRWKFAADLVAGDRVNVAEPRAVAEVISNAPKTMKLTDSRGLPKGEGPACLIVFRFRDGRHRDRVDYVFQDPRDKVSQP